MKRIFQYTYVALLGMMALLVSSCTNKYDYDPVTVGGEQVFFSNTLASSYDVSKSESSFSIPIMRYQTAGALTVPLTVTYEGETFSVPSSVNFADGASEAAITISYKPENIVYGTYETITIQVGDDNVSTPYGANKYSFRVGATAWVPMSGKAMYRDDLVSTWYSFNNPVYEVDIEENVVEKGKYRLVNPYGPAFGKALGYSESQWANYFDAANGPYYLEFDISDPNYCWVNMGDAGITLGEYGAFSFRSYIEYYMTEGGYTLDFLKTSTAAGNFGKFKDGVLTMPERSMLIKEAADEGWSYGNRNSLFAIALPGYVIADYALNWAYLGRFTDAADNDYLRGEFTFGEDVAAVKYNIVPTGSDVDATAAAITDGSIESVEVTEAGVSEVEFNQETGKYILVAVVYNAKGEAVSTETFEFAFKSSKDNAETWTDVAAGVLTLGVKDFSAAISSSGEPWGLFYEGFGLTEPIVGEAVMSQSSNDPTSFKLTPFYSSEAPLFFKYDAESNTIVVDACETGVTGGGGMISVSDFETAIGAGASAYYQVPLSQYNAETESYEFNLIYKGSDGYYAFQQDVFQVTATAGSAIKRAMQRAAEHQQKNKVNTKGQKMDAKKLMIFQTSGKPEVSAVLR